MVSQLSGTKTVENEYNLSILGRCSTKSEVCLQCLVVRFLQQNSSSDLLYIVEFIVNVAYNGVASNIFSW